MSGLFTGIVLGCIFTVCLYSWAKMRLYVCQSCTDSDHREVEVEEENPYCTNCGEEKICIGTNYDLVGRYVGEKFRKYGEREGFSVNSSNGGDS